jgi:hypothetical protein
MAIMLPPSAPDRLRRHPHGPRDGNQVRSVELELVQGSGLPFPVNLTPVPARSVAGQAAMPSNKTIAAARTISKPMPKPMGNDVPTSDTDCALPRGKHRQQGRLPERAGIYRLRLHPGGARLRSN